MLTWLLIAFVGLMAMSLLASFAVRMQTAMSPTDATTVGEIVLAPRAAADEGTLRSPGSDVSTTVRFENRTTRALDIHWLDFAGVRKRYATVEPGGKYANATYVGHVWLVAESSGEGLAIFVADTVPGVAVIS